MATKKTPDFSRLNQRLKEAESLLNEEKWEEAAGLLSSMAEDAEEYIDRNCQTTEDTQYFSFPTPFHQLAYRRVEHDPRKIINLPERLDDLYSELAFALASLGDYSAADAALMQSIRWNPMNCASRLDLAEVRRTNGDIKEWLGLSFSVFSRASEARHIARAYANFATYFDQTEKPKVAQACLCCALNFEVEDGLVKNLVKAWAGTDKDPTQIDMKEAGPIVEAEGLPEGANAEIAVCLLMCATDAADAKDEKLAKFFIKKANDLVGQKACATLLSLIKEADAAKDKKTEHSEKTKQSEKTERSDNSRKDFPASQNLKEEDV